MKKEKKQIAREIEAILFYLAEPVYYKYLSEMLEVSDEQIEESIDELEQNLNDRGICLIKHNDTISLTTSSDMSQIIDKIIREEREKDLGKASMETLAIIVYKGPVSRKEIEYIRGVNCQFALRTLLLRGLIEKNNKEGNERSFLYSITVDAMMHLGIKDISELPEYNNMRKNIEVINEEQVKDDMDLINDQNYEQQ